MANLDKFHELLKSTKEPVLVLFGSDFCGPCQRLKPFFKKTGEVTTNATFVVVDVSEADDIASEYKINRIPEIKVFKNGVQIDNMMGANEELFKKFVTKHTSY